MRRPAPDPPDAARPESGGQQACASDSGAVVQAGRDVLVTVEQHLHLPGRSAWPEGKARQAFLVASAFDHKYWIAELVGRMHRALDRDGVDLVLKLPDRDYDAAAQAHLLRRVLAAGGDYVGGFVVPTEIDRLRPDLVEFCAELGRPVVFTDIEPFGPGHHHPANAAYVGYLGTAIGALAGRWLAAHLAHVPRPRVLMIASREHRDRQDHCARVLREALCAVRITVDDGCAFDRVRAYRAVCAHLCAEPVPDAVFCTNDEMALAAVDALRTAGSPDTVVVGVDGVPEARDLIDSGTSPLRATVVQDSHRLAQCAVHILERMHDGRETPRRVILDPEIHQAATRR
ncbi:sugar ABC transporter substrate-binding protein [Actinosynnema sp. NPDC047251]|uniref:Periplasmic binding protein domain-containing protein n=1 Tax=Saccharothrix espanaensis (strain ATCC 51144 / DSM 44229 / JCM 9112 / NBRC 15066 / NRRL 15764) TaxID=1179773 RepID=K0JTX9_SACES|nr:sugar ABC transporter substrate-binding protein [Saccharothrix espanaensis]CCH31255.1 hypothetical protein BN6_39680 [Saccharothrix espanaensis DSM 44229]